MKCKKLLMLGLVSCMGVGCLAGCSREERDEDFHLESQDGISNFIEKEDIWQEDFATRLEDGTSKTIEIDVEISVLDTENLSVVEVKEVEFDDKRKEKFIKSYFPEGKVYYFDEERGGKVYWEKQGDYVRECLQVLNASWDSCMNQWERESIEADIEIYKAQLETYERKMESCEEDWTTVEEHDGDKYYVSSQEEGYYVSFEEGTDSGFHRYRGMLIEKEDVTASYPEEMKDKVCVSWGEIEVGQNPLPNSERITEEEAKRLADEEIYKLGAKELVYMGCRGIEWHGTNMDTQEVEALEKSDGYQFDYGMGINGISF